MNNQKGLSPVIIFLLIAAATLGYLIYSGKINLNQTQVAQQSKEAPKVDETATYINTKYGIEFRYDKNSEITWDKESYYNRIYDNENKEKDMLTVNVGSVNAFEQHDKDFFELTIRPRQGKCLIPPQPTQKIDIGGQSADYFEGEWGQNGYVGWVCIDRGGNEYEFSFSVLEDTKGNKKFKSTLFKRVLSTFKFTN